MRPLLLLLVLAGPALSGCLHGGVRELGADLMVKPVLRWPSFATALPPFETFRLRTSDGLVLEGDLFLPENEPRGLVLFLHGRDAGRRQGDGAVRFFLSKGYAVAAYDQRAHGRSEGTVMTYGAREVDDARRVIDSLGLAPVYVMGVSMGAAISLQLAAQDPRVRGVIAAAPFSDLLTEWREAAPRALVSDGLFAETAQRAQEKGGFDARTISPERAAATLTVPVLLLHGTNDPLIHPDHSRRILHALKQHGTLMLLQSVRHDDIVDHDLLWPALDGWFTEQFEAPRVATAQRPGTATAAP